MSAALALAKGRLLSTMIVVPEHHVDGGIRITHRPPQSGTPGHQNIVDEVGAVAVCIERVRKQVSAEKDRSRSVMRNRVSR
jgi:hypothetical protein